MTNVQADNINLNPITIGTDAVYVFTFPYSIAGFSYEAAVRRLVGTTIIIDFTINIDDINNRVTLSLTDTETADLLPGLRAWYLIQTDTDGQINKTHYGKVRVEKP